MSLEINVDRGRDEVGIHLKGDIDVDSIQQLQTELLRAVQDRPRELVVDLTNAEIGDSMGASTFTLAKREAEIGGVNLRLTSES